MVCLDAVGAPTRKWGADKFAPMFELGHHCLAFYCTAAAVAFSGVIQTWGRNYLPLTFWMELSNITHSIPTSHERVDSTQESLTMAQFAVVMQLCDLGIRPLHRILKAFLLVGVSSSGEALRMNLLCCQRFHGLFGCCWGSNKQVRGR